MAKHKNSKLNIHAGHGVATSKKIKKILLVDDEPDIRKIVEISLTAIGKWEVLQASSGEEALFLAASAQPDLILLDMLMPTMDGSVTLCKLRAQENTTKIPVIFMTAKAQKHEVEQYLAMGAIGVITKPFDPMQLPTQIRDIIEKAIVKEENYKTE